jgi:hypothetical protein
MPTAGRSRDPWRLPDGSGFAAATSRFLARLLGPLLGLVGVERALLPALLGLQHAVDQRRASENQAGWVRGLVGLAAFKSGLFVVLVAYLLRAQAGSDLLWVLAFCQCFAICALVLVVFHSDALVDGDDLRILAPTPVKPRTVYAARCLHMASHALVYALLCGVFPLALGPLATKDAWPLLLVPPVVAAAFAAAVGSTALAHTLLLAVVGARRFERAALALRVALFSALYLATQALPRRPDLLQEAWHGPARAWTPPTCFAQLGPFVRGEADFAAAQGAFAWLAACFALLPLAILAASRTYLAALQEPERAHGEARGVRESAWLAWLGDRLCRDHAERAGFGLAGALAWRERPFLRQALVSAAGLLIASATSLLVPGAYGATGLAWLAEARFAALVGLAILVPTMLDLARFSAQPEARWVHAAAPLPNLDGVHRGALLGVACSFCLPIMAGTAAAVALFVGRPHSVAVLACLGLALATGLWFAPRFAYFLPFSEPFTWQDNSLRNFGAVLALMGLLGMLVLGAGAVLALVPLGEWALLALSGVLLPAAWGRFRAAPGPISAARPPRKATSAAH